MRNKTSSPINRWWQDFELNSLGFYVLLPLTGTVFIAKVVLYIALAFVVYVEVSMLPSALRLVTRAFREAEALGETDSTQLKGGELRQEGSERKGSLVCPGGPLSSDDLRRRLYELREVTPGKKVSLTRNVGGQYGKQ